MITVSCEKGHELTFRYRGKVEKDQNRGTCLCSLQFKPVVVCEERGYKSLTCSDCPFLIAQQEVEA